MSQPINVYFFIYFFYSKQIIVNWLNRTNFTHYWIIENVHDFNFVYPLLHLNTNYIWPELDTFSFSKRIWEKQWYYCPQCLPHIPISRSRAVYALYSDQYGAQECLISRSKYKDALQQVLVLVKSISIKIFRKSYCLVSNKCLHFWPTYLSNFSFPFCMGESSIQCV